MTTFVSKECPPNARKITLIMQRRNGELVEYKTGAYRPEAKMKAEIGGCGFCIGIVSFAMDDTVRMSSSHPRFHRHAESLCAKCRPIVERLDEIEREIFALKRESSKLNDYQMPEE